MLDKEAQNPKTFLARLEDFPVLRDWLESTLMSLSTPMKPLQQLLIAADEIFTNIASYAYPNSTGNVNVALAYDRQTNVFSMTFTDQGVPFNPLMGAAPDTTTPLSERKVGGLGILVVKKMMDTVEYQFKNGCNILTLKKSLAVPPEVTK